MPIHFEDRQAKYPNRWTMKKSDGTSEVVTLIRNDEPTVEGTPMNAETLNQLSDVAGADVARAQAEAAAQNAREIVNNAEENINSFAEASSQKVQKDIDAKAAETLKTIPESYTELDGSVKQLKENLSVYKSTLKASNIKWVTATCYKGEISFDYTIITSDFFKLEKGSIIKINNENLKSRLTTYTSEKKYLKDSGDYVHVDSYEIKDNGNFYRLSIGNTSGDYSANDSWVGFISFENAQSFNEFVLENEYKSALYNKDEPFSELEWVSGSIYQGVLDEKQTINISSSVFKAIEGTLIIIPDNWSVRLTFYNDDKSFKVSYGYMKYKQYIVPYDCYMALSLYDGSSPMNTEKGREVKIYYGYKSKISSLEEKTTSLEEKIISTIDPTLSLPGKAADSKATGDAISAVKARQNVLTGTETGNPISVDDAFPAPLCGLTVYGKSTQDGTPTPDAPVPIASAGDGGSVAVTLSDGNGKTQTLTLLTPNGLPGIPVTSGGNYTDQSGQQWMCDEVDLERGVKVQKVGKLSDTKNWRVERGNQNFSVFATAFNVDSIKNDSLVTYTSNMFVAIKVDSRYAINTVFINSGGVVVVTLKKGVTLETFLDVIKDKFVLYFALATPIETPLTPAELAAYKALTAYGPDTVVQAGDGVGIQLGYQRDVNIAIKKLEDAVASMT